MTILLDGGTKPNVLGDVLDCGQKLRVRGWRIENNWLGLGDGGRSTKVYISVRKKDRKPVFEG